MKKKNLLGSLFGAKKKAGCCSGKLESKGSGQIEKPAADLVIKVLGSGCRNCSALVENVKKALDKLAVSARVEKVTDFKAIAGYGVMSTPALVANEKVIAAGRVLNTAEIEELLQEMA